MVSQLETSSLNLERSLPPTVEGLIQVFTGAHRNFFTGVMAQALRISAQGMPVLVVQFLKGGIGQGYDNPMKFGQHLDWIRCDLPRCIDTPHLDETESASLQRLWQHTQDVVLQGKYALVVLDELSLAIKLGLIPQNEVLTLLENRPAHIDIILTGPEMPPALLEVADQITEIRRSYRP